MKWEYKVFSVDHFFNSSDSLTVEQKLNKYGEDGWEVMGVLEKPYTTLGNPPKLDTNSIVLKRAVKI